MENESNEQTVITAQPAVAEEELGVAEDTVSLGKFKDSKALLNAYNSLQAEFTKRCQRVKELESVVSSFDKERAEDKSQNTPTPNEEQLKAQATANAKSITEEDKAEILKDYLKGITRGKQTAIVMDGTGMGLQTLAKKPSTLVEAGEIAKQILSK